MKGTHTSAARWGPVQAALCTSAPAQLSMGCKGISAPVPGKLYPLLVLSPLCLQSCLIPVSYSAMVYMTTHASSGKHHLSSAYDLEKV